MFEYENRGTTYRIDIFDFVLDSILRTYFSEINLRKLPNQLFSCVYTANVYILLQLEYNYLLSLQLDYNCTAADNIVRYS